jgi:hypothetical protein
MEKQSSDHAVSLKKEDCYRCWVTTTAGGLILIDLIMLSISPCNAVTASGLFGPFHEKIYIPFSVDVNIYVPFTSVVWKSSSYDV